MSEKDYLTGSIADNTIKALLDEAIFPTFGKNLKEGSDSDKKDSDGEGLWAAVEAQAAFLGPNIWDKTLAGEADLKYVDLDEFLSENGIPLDQSPSNLGQASPSSARGEGGGGEGPSNLASRRGVMLTSELHINTKHERSPSPNYDPPLSPSTVGPPSPTDSTMSFSSTAGGREFDPRTRAFSDEELKPQPMIKKSRKQLVPETQKDDKYWARRRKNNMAAKRSRDARRVKENQIALRAGFLEKEVSKYRSQCETHAKINLTLKQENEKLKKELLEFKKKFSTTSPII